MISALVAGAAMYYLPVYHFYEEVAATGTDDVQLTSLVTGAPEPVMYDAFQAIDADSSPIRYRACFDVLADTPDLQAEPYPAAVPRNAPFWFSCFDAEAIADQIGQANHGLLTVLPLGALLGHDHAQTVIHKA